MIKSRNTSRIWAWLMVVLAGAYPFVADVSRNFQMFSQTQLIWSLAAILAATTAVFGLAWLSLLLIEAAIRRAGRFPRAGLANIWFALAAAAVFAFFLFGSNTQELRRGFGLSRPVTASVVVMLFSAYWAGATKLGAKWTCALLAGLLTFSLVQAGMVVANASTRHDQLVSAENIHTYSQVKLTQTPNIYYISLESYHGFDAMQKLYGFDNADFHGFLERNKFTTEKEILANYSFTMSSFLSFFLMGHHYGLLDFGNHDNLYARDFVSGTKNCYNPVLSILKQNDYSIVYLLTSDYHYRPGAGLVDKSLLGRPWPLAPLRLTLPHFIPRHRVIGKWMVADAMASWPLDKPTFFFMKMGAEHVPFDTHSFRTDREAFVAKYVGMVKESNKQVEALCRKIIEKDPQGIIILTGDHGAHSYQSEPGGSWKDTEYGEDIPPALLVQDIHDVLLTIRWGDGMEPAHYPFRSLVNVMRFVFYRLGASKEFFDTAAPDDSYFRDGGKGIYYQTAQEGHPLDEWIAVSPSSR